MSRAAVELLVSAIRAGKAIDRGSRHRTLDYTLIRRQSDAAPRQRPPTRRA
jgi:LacI family transcriptional regulator